MARMMAGIVYYTILYNTILSCTITILYYDDTLHPCYCQRPRRLDFVIAAKFEVLNSSTYLCSCFGDFGVHGALVGFRVHGFRGFAGAFL